MLRTFCTNSQWFAPWVIAIQGCWQLAAPTFLSDNLHTNKRVKLSVSSNIINSCIYICKYLYIILAHNALYKQNYILLLLPTLPSCPFPSLDSLDKSLLVILLIGSEFRITPQKCRCMRSTLFFLLFSFLFSFNKFAIVIIHFPLWFGFVAFFIQFALIYFLCCGIFLRVKWGQVEIVVQCANGNKVLRNLSHDMTHNELKQLEIK